MTIRITSKRQKARLRVTKMQIAILDAMDKEGASEIETRLAMLELMSRWENAALIQESP